MNNIPLIVFLHIVTASPQDGQITCSIPSVEPDQDIALTCLFPEDLNATQKDFSVYYYTDDTKPEAVLDCWWMTGILKCFENRGYKFNMTVNTQLTLNISHVMSTNKGTYACQIAGYKPSSFRTCQFASVQSNDEKRITCLIALVQIDEDVSLTCHFPEDLSVVRKDFSVYHVTTEGNQYAVVDCRWNSDEMKCIANSGYEYKKTDGKTLKITIRNAISSNAGFYVCEVAGYRPSSFGICSLPISNNIKVGTCRQTILRNTTFTLLPAFLTNPGDLHKADHQDNTLKIGLSVGSLLLAALVATGIVLFVKHRRNGLPSCFKTRQDTKRMEQGQPMLKRDKGANTQCQKSEKLSQITKTFQKHLEHSVKQIYPNMSRGCYFVPPILFNKTAYKRQSFYGQCVYVPHPSKLNDIRKDRAMQHVMHCLRHFPKNGEQQMFVLTQFQYEDYLNNPGDNFKRHSLPVPAGLPVLPDKKGQVDNAACFDFLIIHRLHGVLVGVVKAVGEEDEESKSNEQMKIERVVYEVKEALEQLRLADRMLRHLMSDQQPFPKVRHTLILPNITRATLQQAVQDHNDVVEKLREGLDVNALKDPTKQCLCSEHLSNHNEPWNVSKYVVQNMQDIWMWTTSNTEKDVNITDDVYLSLIARFVGPATQSTLQIPGNCEPFPLPKTLCEAVSMTGELYGRSIFHEDAIKRLKNESQGFLVGPPNTGKTRMLSLVGGKCLSNGQNVFVVKDKCSPNDWFLSQHLIKLKQRSTSQHFNGVIYEETCDLSINKSVEKFVKKVTGIKGNKGNCVLLDNVHFETKRAKTFCKALLKECPKVQLWVSCTGDSSPEILPYSKHCTEILNCPPAVVREVATTKENTNKCEDAKNKNIILPPTDGPPVKIIYYYWSVRSEPHDSLKCGQDVGSFLSKELLITESDESTRQSDSTTHLQCKDVLIVFDKDCAIAEDSNFLTGLRQTGITVQAAVNNGNNDVSDDGINSAWAMNVRYMDTYRVKRKVVVYVEYSKMIATDQENKNRALTSCTSQLILVKPSVNVS